MVSVYPTTRNAATLPLDSVAMSGNIPFKVPTTPDSIDKEFFTSMFRCQGHITQNNEVLECESEIIGADKGFTSTVTLCKLKYKTKPEEGTAPDKIVVKLMGGGITVKKKVEKYLVHNIIFPNEIRFFSECRVPPYPATHFRYPRSFFCASRKPNHLMVMEDMSKFGFCGSGKSSATLNECRAIMTCLARVHAHFWGKRHHEDSPSTCQNLFAGSDLKSYPLLIRMVFPDAIKVMRQAFPMVIENVGESCMKSLQTHWKSIAYRLREPPFTLCHGDVKMDNVFFSHGNEEGKSHREACCVDWGVCGWGNPMGDVGYFFGRCVDVVDRRTWCDDLLNIYRNELVRVNPDLNEIYTVEKMKEDLRLMCLVPFFTVMGTLKGMMKDVENKTGTFSPKDKMSEDDKIKREWMDKSFMRISQLMKDMNVESKIMEGAADPGCAPIPCCCLWTMP